MKRRFAQAVAVGCMLVGCATAVAQKWPTATQDLELSAWGGASGSYTGIYGSRNLSVTAGAALAFKPFHGIRPAVEVRGTLPLRNGQYAGERNMLVGATFSKNVLPRLDIYGDFFWGKGKIIYQGGGLLDATGTFAYTYNYSNVFSPGGGVEYRLTRHISLKADVQLQRYETPFTQTFFQGPIPVADPIGGNPPVAAAYIIDTPSHAVAKVITVGAKYRFNYNRRRPR